jgi:RNase P/RNase MRP subunit p29
MSNDEMVEISAELVRETDNAFLLSDGDREVWVPKRFCTWAGKHLWELPTWIAKDRGLI